MLVGQIGSASPGGAARGESVRGGTSRGESARGGGSPGSASRGARGDSARGGTSRGEQIRSALLERLDELRGERSATVSAMRDSGAADAGDDVADLGTKAFTLEQDYLLVANFQNQIDQIAHALDRLERGSYGWCERCGDEIPVARLAAFPSATQCVRCKQIEERR